VVPHKGAKYTGVVPQAERNKWEGGYPLRSVARGVLL